MILAIADDLSEVIEKINEVIATTKSLRRMMTSVPCSWFDSTIDDLIDIAWDISEHRNISVYADTITSYTVQPCSAAEHASLQTAKKILEGLVNAYEYKLLKGDLKMLICPCSN